MATARPRPLVAVSENVFVQDKNRGVTRQRVRKNT